jgi:hypothetical protein
LSDPLEPLGNQWRDRFAELLVQFASTHKALIVVTNLSTRPASWIDNAAVARIQVGDEIQRTIGFGSEQSKAQAIVQQLRDAATVAPSSQKNSPATENKKPQSTGFSLTESREEPAPAPFFETVALSCIFGFLDRLGFEYNDQRVYERFLSVQQLITSPMIGGLIAGSIILMGGSYLISSKDAHSPDHVARLNVPVEPIPSAPEQDVASGSTAETQPSNSAPIPSEQPAEPAPPIRMSILDEYPPSIKASIQASFQGLSTALDTPASSTGPRTKSSNPKEETGELLKLLETTSDSGEGVPDSPPPSEQYYDNQQQIAPSTQNSASNPGSEEEKREAIRKRFLEAIERAQSMRRQGGSE